MGSRPLVSARPSHALKTLCVLNTLLPVTAAASTVHVVMPVFSRQKPLASEAIVISIGQFWWAHPRAVRLHQVISMKAALSKAIEKQLIQEAPGLCRLYLPNTPKAFSCCIPAFVQPDPMLFDHGPR